jgi:hypothetical protein
VKKHAGTIALVVLALGLGLWLWLDRDRITAGERKGRENSAFVVWRRDELTKVSIAHDGETIVLERDRPPSAPGGKGEGKEGKWRMTSPRQERADAVAVERLLTTLELAAVARKVGSGAPLGLDAPRAVGHVWMGGLDVGFALGGPSPTPEGSSYMRVGEEPPIVVTKEVAEVLLAPSDRYRDRTVVPYLATELSRFEVKHEGGAFALERIDEQSLRVAELGVLASRAAVERLWAALAEMRAEAFPNDADIDRLTAHPVVTLRLTPKDATSPPAELVLGEACPGHPADVVVLRRAPSRAAACAPKDVVATFVAGADALVEKHLLPLRMDEIEELRIEHEGTQPLELARKGTGFHLRFPEDRDLTAGEADAATELITRIARSEATTVARGGAPFASVGRVVARFGEHEQVLELSAPGEGGRATVRRLLDDARLEVDASVYRRLVPRATSVRPRNLAEDPKRLPTRVLLRCGKDQELVDRGEGFRLVAPAAYETDGSTVQLVESLTKGHIDTWVADADDGSFGFTKDGCRVILGFADGNAAVTVSFGATGEGGLYVKADPRPGVAVAPRALRDLAKSLYVSRGLLRTEAARIESIRVTSEGKPVPVRDLDELRGAMAGLFALRVASFDKPDGPPNLVLEVAVTEGGPRRRITCRSTSPLERACALDGVNATLLVPEAKLTPFLGPGAARDGGTEAGAGPADAGKTP